MSDDMIREKWVAKEKNLVWGYCLGNVKPHSTRLGEELQPSLANMWSASTVSAGLSQIQNSFWQHCNLHWSFNSCRHQKLVLKCHPSLRIIIVTSRRPKAFWLVGMPHCSAGAPFFLLQLAAGLGVTLTPVTPAFPHTASLSPTFSTLFNLSLLLRTLALGESSSLCKLALEEHT